MRELDVEVYERIVRKENVLDIGVCARELVSEIGEASASVVDAAVAVVLEGPAVAFEGPATGGGERT